MNHSTGHHALYSDKPSNIIKTILLWLYDYRHDVQCSFHLSNFLDWSRIMNCQITLNTQTVINTNVLTIVPLFFSKKILIFKLSLAALNRATL